uniref:Uncharacterized protein n=1 Tax=Felis catus TaxID=9685 RepID=A0ABI7XN78_FELCA
MLLIQLALEVKIHSVHRGHIQGDGSLCGLVANRGRCFKWAIELSRLAGGSRSQSDQGSSQGDSLYPDSCLDKQRGSATGTLPWVPSSRFP